MSTRFNGANGANKPQPSPEELAIDFLSEKCQYLSREEVNEKWEDIIDGAIADQHAVMKAAGGLPPEWEAAFQKSLKEKEARRAVKQRKE